MDAVSSGAINLPSVIEALFFMLLVAIGVIAITYGTRTLDKLQELGRAIESHAEQDRDMFAKQEHRMNGHAQRLTKLDGRME